MKKIITLFSLLCMLGICLHAQSVSQAEADFEKNNFANAKSQYEKIITHSSGTEKLQAQLRLAACQYHLGEYLNAAKELYAYEFPQDPIWKARFLLYRIEISKQVARRYARILNEHTIDTPEAKADLETWTKKQWNEQIDKDFRQLWALRENLINAPIEAENLILTLKDSDLRRIPTLFDFTVQTWLEFLNDNSTGIKPAALTAALPTFLEGKARIKKGQNEPITRLQAEILETAYTLEGTNRANARVFWETDFILFPVEHKNNFVFNTEKEALSVATKQLNKLSGNTRPETTSWWQKMKDYFYSTPQPDTSYARTYTIWKTAQLLNDQNQFAEALEVCNFASSLPSSYFTQACENLAKRIHQISLRIDQKTTPLNREAPELYFTGKNLHTLYVKVFATSFQELQHLFQKHCSNCTLAHWEQVFNAPEQEDFLSFLKHTPLQTISQPVTFEEPGKTQKGMLPLKPLAPGIYVVIVSADEHFNPKTSPLQAIILNATDLALFASAGIEGNPDDFTVLRNTTSKKLTPNVFHLYGVNLKTGQPVSHLPIDLITGWQKREKTQLQTDGTASLKREIILSAANRQYVHYEINALAQQNNSTTYTENLYFSFSPSSPVSLTAQTDRAIYRPGQQVQLGIQAFERQVRGWKTLSNQKVEITVRDPNWKPIFTTSLSVNELGAGQTQFTLPQEGLLGNYQVEAKLIASNNTYPTSYSFKVEEFKRPDYEVTLETPQKALEFGKSSKLTGKAAYYFGAPLVDAKVVYTVKRKAYIPPFYWWWNPWWNHTPDEILLQGETKTDNQGNFTVSFVPTKAQEGDEFAQFVLEAEVYDESGRPIEATHSYNVSQHPHLFKVDFAQGFYDENKETELAKIDLTDADGKSTTGKIHLKAQLLENKLPTSKQTSFQEGDYFFESRENQSLEELYRDFAAQKTAFEKTLSFVTPGEQAVRLPALPQGVYRLELSSEKAASQQLIFVVASNHSTLQLPAITLAQHNTYYPGETLRILLGASPLQGAKRVEIYQANDFLIHKEKLAAGAEIFEFPVTQAMRGGLALRWFGASNYQFYEGQTAVEVPFDNKQLNVKLEVPQTLLPGTQTDWKLSVKNAFGASVNGLVHTTVYDKSLDYYTPYRQSLTFTNLFPQHKSLPGSTNSNHGAHTSFLGGPDLKEKSSFPFLHLPTLNLAMRSRAYRSFGGKQMLAMNMAAVPRAAMAKSLNADAMDGAVGGALEESAEMARGAFSAEMDEKSVTQSLEKQPNANLRTDFAETAYFNAALPLTNGQAQLKFTIPQSLTTWNILGFVITRTADFGNFTAQTVTRKNFMLRLTLPRFYREADKGTLQVAITNQTDKTLTTQVTLNISLNQKSALTDWGIQTPDKTLTVAPNSTQFVHWDITAPYAPDLYQITAVARSGKESDGEQKELPVLPSKQRVLATSHTALKNGNNTLSLTELKNIPAGDVEITSLTINPSLALSVLNSMPNLLTNPCKDLVSSLNRYVPLAVVHQFYSTYPELKQAVKKLPKRTGLTAPWEENNPLRLELLTSTPWLRQAQGRKEHTADIISLFDDKLVASLLSKELKNITKFQNTSGAFTWFAGGPDDEYLTLYALDAFAQALNYQAKIPQNEAQKAFKYIYPKIESRLKQDKEGSVGAVAYALYAAYTLSAFPQSWPHYSAAKPYIKRWVDYADEQAKFMTPLGQIYAATVYHRLGDDVKANRYLDLVISRMKEDPLTGAYFAPEAQSWLWYNDTLTTQTTTLRALLEIRPNAPQIDAMTQWLLFNRQVNDWTNSKAASQAVFTLLDVMKAKGALATPSQYSFRWGNSLQRISLEPFDWTQDLKFTHTAPQISPADYQVVINKQGAMTDFASLNAIYRAHDLTASPKGVLNVSRQYFRRVKEGTDINLVPVENLDNVQVGDEIEVHLTLTTNSAFEYVEIKDPKPAGFESEDLLSRWDWKPLSFYKEVRDASTNFFVNWLPNGTVTLRYVLRPTVPGKFHAAAAQAQSMYAPEYGAHTATTVVEVTK